MTQPIMLPDACKSNLWLNKKHRLTVPLRNKRPKIYAKYAYAFAHTPMLIGMYELAYCFFFSL